MITAGIIVASGRGTRMTSKVPKQFLPLCGRPILEWTVQSFLKTGCMHELIIVLPKDFLGAYKPKRTYARTVIRTVTGGRRRVDSVKAGLRAVSAVCDMVAIHDAVRPLIKPRDIVRCINAAKKYGSAIAAAPCSDTVKRSTKKGFVKDTLDRSDMWLVQTPQVFKKKILTGGFKGILPDVTDDSQIIERMGKKVKIIPVGKYNRKITYQEDLIYAETVLRMRRK